MLQRLEREQMMTQLPGAEAGVVCPEKHVPQERLARDSAKAGIVIMVSRHVPDMQKHSIASGT